MKKSLPAIIALGLSLSASAQLTVTSAGSASNIASMLTGSGVTISNVVLTGDTQAFAFFTAANTPLNMTGGLMLSTGLCSTVAGPNLLSGMSHGFGTTYNDPNLMSIEPSLVNDVAMIEFDCVPSDDTLYFNYVFGSEEYPEYVGSAFNDGFGLFVTGVNPLGGNYVAANIATIPNGTTVTINNVNNGNANTGPCSNCSFYTDNTTSQVLEFDGTTTNLTAVIPVAAQTTYHLKIAVADAGDIVFDSGVFLQAGSFRSGGTLSVADRNRGDFCLVPNPATEEITIRLSENFTDDVRVEILDATGKIVRTETSNGVNALRYNVSSLSSGMYFVRITGKETVSVRPLIIASR